jgi:hypothetical protein
MYQKYCYRFRLVTKLLRLPLLLLSRFQSRPNLRPRDAVPGFLPSRFFGMLAFSFRCGKRVNNNRNNVVLGMRKTRNNTRCGIFFLE